MTCDTARERLHDQIDGTIDPVAAHDLQRHLKGCASCRGLAADLAAIAGAADALEPIDPPEHVWLQLAGRWRHEQHAPAGTPAAAGPRPRLAAFHWLAAAAVLTVAVGGGWIAWRATDDPAAEPGPRTEGVLLARQTVAAGNANADVLVESAKSDLDAAEDLYVRAIAGLEQAASQQKAELAPEVASVIDKNIEVLDQAIVQSRAAVQAQPASVEARESLFEALRKKVALLQNTIRLVSEISRGQGGAARLSGT